MNEENQVNKTALPTLDVFRPSNRAQVANLSRPKDLDNSPQAWRYLHPEDPLFGQQGTVIVATVQGREQQKNVGAVKHYQDVDSHVRAFIGEVRDEQRRSLTVLRDRKAKLESYTPQPEEEITAVAQQIEEAKKQQLLAYRIICRVPFRTEDEASRVNGKPIGGTESNQVEVRAFDSEKAVADANRAVGPEPCRNYGTPEIRYYTPEWVII